MSEPNSLEQASRELQACTVLLRLAILHGKANRLNDAYETLQLMQDEYERCNPPLREALKRLTLESDGPVGPFEIMGQPYYWSSAHETVLEITRLALEWLYNPVVGEYGVDPKSGHAGLIQETDPEKQMRNAEQFFPVRSDWFVFDRDMEARLDERIQRERAKLVEVESNAIERPVADLGESITDDEYTILRALRDAHPIRVKVIELEAATTIRRAVCGKLLASLAKRSLVDYDSSLRNGAAITPKGKAILEQEKI